MNSSKINYFNNLEKEWSLLVKKKNIFLKKEPCPVCKKKNYSLIFIKKKINFVFCNICTHVFINPFFKKKIIDNHFFHSKTWGDWSKKVLSQKKQKKIEVEKYKYGIKYLKSLKKKNLSILDVGSSSGNFIEIALKNKWKIDGIEPSINSYNYLKKKFDCTFYNSLFENTYLKKKYDVITCWASFEYSSNITSFIQKAEKYLKPKGKFIIYISGNSNSLIMRTLREHCAGFLFNRKNYFNPVSLDYLLRKKFKRKHIKSDLNNSEVVNNYLNYIDPYIMKKNIFSFKFFEDKFLLKNLMGYKFLTVYEKK